MAAEDKVRFRDVFSWRFAINCFFSLLATIWFPLARLQAVDEDGNVLSTSTLPMYRMYWAVIQNPLSWTAWWYIFVHIVIITSVSFFVWYLFLKARKKSLAEAASGETQDG